MQTDPILREVYRMKDEFARQFNYDVDKMFKHFREQAKKHPERIVNLVPQPTPRAKRRTAPRKAAK